MEQNNPIQRKMPHDADAEQARQGVDHAHGVGVAALLAHPGDGVQGIIKEMRVYLGFQCG